eukprot:CAMPEP_0179983546 /NCGR_PEP_ID=MMETSP0984-20121128/618_1 /TAXON_ID=483367 /ORGANISM="non described non described, Strain CCMP 2436" /LENGTH=209 /DNA_ID=CAMNT_0021901995 /DNA_START=14 /DNA_END=643 /DNA_ORIENTATION=-
MSRRVLRNPRRLLQTLPLGPFAISATLHEKGALPVTAPLLAPSECAAVARWARQQLSPHHASKRRAAGAAAGPNQRVHIHAQTLRRLIGHRAFFRLRHCLELLAPAERVGRRDFMAFVHVCSPTRDASPGADPPADYCSGARIVDIALNGDNEVRGGRLLAMRGPRLVEVPRRAGDAIRLDVWHAMTRVEEGARYSLLLHFLGMAEIGS